MKVPTLILVGLVTAQCPVRREFRELSQQEQQIYFQAIQRLHQTPVSYRGARTMFEYFTRVHIDSSPLIHGTSIFLPWHRHFTYLYEQELRKIDPRVVLPYWDWSLDSAEPHQSRVLQMMGGNGDYNRGYCVTQGPFAYWQVNVPGPHCLRRDYDMGQRLSPFSTPESISLDCNEPQFSEFALRFEIKHGNPHVNIGGNNGDFSTMHSPNDPLFYMHHAFVDMVWAEWQQRNPRSPFEGSRFGEQYNANTVLPFFNITVGDTLDTSRYCYFYNRYPRFIQPRQLPPTIQPSFNSFSNNNPFLGNWGRQQLSFVLLNRGRDFPRTRLDLPGVKTDFKEKKRNPLPESFLRMNNLDPTVVRELEHQDNKLVDLINSLSYSPMNYAQSIIEDFA